MDEYRFVFLLVAGSRESAMSFEEALLCDSLAFIEPPLVLGIDLENESFDPESVCWDDVCVAALIDLPSEVLESGSADIFTVRTTMGHLLKVQIASEGEIICPDGLRTRSWGEIRWFEMRHDVFDYCDERRGTMVELKNDWKMRWEGRSGSIQPRGLKC